VGWPAFILALLPLGAPTSAASAPASLPVVNCASAAPTTSAEQIVRAAETYLGREYVFGGRGGRPGCRDGKKRVRCLDGIDCQSLIFFSYESALGRAWTRYAVIPSISIQRGELGQPVAKLDGVLRDDIDRTLLRRGDVLFFLLDGYNLDADKPLLVRGGAKYGTWHTGLVHCGDGGEVQVIHAKPGDRVTIEPLDAISFDALYVVRLSTPARSRERSSSSRPASTPAGPAAAASSPAAADRRR
jgi:hypothetical protein